jgi:hypothetical protein
MAQPFLSNHLQFAVYNHPLIIIIIIMSIVPLETWVVYKSSPDFSVSGDKPEITPAVLSTYVQCITDKYY